LAFNFLDMVIRLFCTALLAMLFVNTLFSQTTLERMLSQTETNYPALKAGRYNTEAAAHALKAGRNDFFPKATIAYQGNYATANNISGMTFPGQLLPISGPTSVDNDYTLVSGSAASLLMTWSPYTFGQRSSHIGRLRAEAEEASMEEALSLFSHKIRFIETYLDYQEVLILEEALQSELERLDYSLTLSRQLSINGIRPGVDTATVKAEYAKSQVEWLRLNNRSSAIRHKLSELLLGDPDNLLDEKPSWFEQNVNVMPGTQNIHPFLALTRTRLQASEARKKEIRSTLMPKLTFWGTGFARGSAIGIDRSIGSAHDGWEFSRYNYGVGFQLTIPLLDFASTSQKLKQQQLIIGVAEEMHKQALLELDTEKSLATITLDNAIKSAEYANTYLDAAKYAFGAIQVRYESGLTNLLSLLDGQQQLKQAEAELARAQSELWKAVLFKAAVMGDISLFIEQTR
jgi:outer membrane protein